MLKYGYPRRISIGTVVFAGSLPLIVPPSINMIMYGLQSGVSIGGLFAGGVGAALVMATLGIIYVLVWSYIHKDKVPVAQVRYTLREKIIALKGLIGPLIIIFGTLYSIFSGMATPTEAGGMGNLLTILYALFRRRLSMKILKEVALEVTKNMAMIIIIITGGFTFGSILSAIGGRRILQDFMASLPAAEVTAFWVAQLIIIILGMFLDNLTICIVFAPLLAGILEGFGYDPLWIGVVFMTTVMTELLSPPVGMSMFLFKGMRPEVPMKDIYLASLPFFGLMCLTVAVIILFPQTVYFFIDLFIPK